MKVFAITGKSTTFKVSDEEKELFNEIAIQMQARENMLNPAKEAFTNSGQVVFALISYCKEIENDLVSLGYDYLPKTRENIEKITNEIEFEKPVIIENVESMEVISTENSAENTENNSEIKQQLIEIIGLDNPTDEQLFSELYFMAKSYGEKSSEIETPEISTQLTENDIILHLTTNQKDLFETIAQKRVENGLDKTQNTISEIILRMLANEDILTNYYGTFETCIRLKNLK